MTPDKFEDQRSLDGRFAGACAYEGAKFAVCDEKGPRLETCAYLFKQAERPKRG